MYSSLAVILSSILFAVLPLHAQHTGSTTPPSQATSAAEPPAIQAAPPALTNPPASEDWSTIELAKSGLPLKATGGVLLSKVELPGCTRELLRMQWRPNDPIDLYVIRPNGSQPMPVVLFLYNYTYDSDIFRADRWCDRAKENGFAVVGFPSALAWSRLHTPRPLKQWFVSQLQESLAITTHDVQMVLNYLKTRGDLDMDHVGVFGQGSGGAVAILAAAADPRIRTLNLMDPWGDWPAWIKSSKQIPEEERASYLEPEFLAKVAGLDPVHYLPQLKDRRIRIEQVIDDPVTPPAARESMAKAAPMTSQVTQYPNRTDEAKGAWDERYRGLVQEQVRSGKEHPLHPTQDRRHRNQVVQVLRRP